MHVCADTNACQIVLHVAKLILNAPSDSWWIYENVDERKKMAKSNEFGANESVELIFDIYEVQSDAKMVF